MNISFVCNLSCAVGVEIPAYNCIIIVIHWTLFVPFCLCVHMCRVVILGQDPVKDRYNIIYKYVYAHT